MKILPDYLIEYMPELEEAMEELRLSVLDHAYELLQRLDIDELSTDEICKKLELYELSTDNMSGDWLPNGRFYRIYPMIKYHRTRHNTIKSIAKSGGQFEGLWSKNFSNKMEYQFKDIQVNRHYELQNNADGYFFISGDTIKNSNGEIISSAVTALSTDILINQALPAGYTYIYIPFPRPAYSGDSNCFYNVNMLMHDRLYYANECEYIWTSKGELRDTQNDKLIGTVYYCNENSVENKYCLIKYGNLETDFNNILYAKSIKELTDEGSAHYFYNSTIDTEKDHPFYSSLHDEKEPASTRYDWKTGTNTPLNTPYWIDYHYMNDLTRELPTNKQSGGSWAVVEHGTYYDEDNNEVFNLKDAVSYKLDDECIELNNSRSVFPTRCYLKERIKTTEPNRLQKFTPEQSAILIKDFNNEKVLETICNIFYIKKDALPSYYKDIPSTYNIISNEGNTFKVEVTLLGTYRSYNGMLSLASIVNYHNEVIKNISFIDGKWVSNVYDVKPTITRIRVLDYNTLKIVSKDILIKRFELEIEKLLLDTGIKCNYTKEFYPESIDTNDLSNTGLCLTKYDKYNGDIYHGQYRFDILSNGYALQISDKLSHFKTYRTFWNEKTPFIDMVQNKTDIFYEDLSAKSSLYNWIELKQNNNIPRISLLENQDISNTVINNKPSASEITFTSYDRPTRGKLDTLYIGYFCNDNNVTESQDTNTSVNNYYNIYEFDDDYSAQGNTAKLVQYDPEYYYTLISLNYNDAKNEQHTILNQLGDSSEDGNDHILASLIGDPANKEKGLHVRIKPNTEHTQGISYNYLTFKKSRIYKLWFSPNHTDVTLNTIKNVLYSFYSDSLVYSYSSNTVNFDFNIIGIYHANGKKIAFKSCEMNCILKNGKYELSTGAIKINAPVFETDAVKYVTEAAYILFTVKVVTGSVKVETSSKTSTNLSYALGIKSCIIGEVSSDFSDVKKD